MGVLHRGVVVASLVVAATALAAPAKKPPPAKKKPPPAKKPADDKPPGVSDRDRHWEITKKDDKCFSDNYRDVCIFDKQHQEPGCFVPPLHDYPCPADVRLPELIILRAGTDKCFIDSTDKDKAAHELPCPKWW